MERYGFIEECIKILEKHAFDSANSEMLFLVRRANVELLQLTFNENDDEMVSNVNYKELTPNEKIKQIEEIIGFCKNNIIAGEKLIEKIRLEYEHDCLEVRPHMAAD